MRRVLKKYIRRILQKFDIALIRYSGLKNEESNRNASFDLDFLSAMPSDHVVNLLNLMSKSESQLRQDLFVLSTLNFKRNGYFVEFGATDGIGLSNSYLLEKEFSWNGILSEPARVWHQELINNRNAHIEKLCVWKDSNSVLSFNEVDIAELSTINSYSSSDIHSKSRHGGHIYDVRTISLNDLLEKYRAPNEIDYLSIDTEGSEFEILSQINFKKYSFKVITCEHNFTTMRHKIYDLLTNQGYKRVHEDISKFDDWYIKI